MWNFVSVNCVRYKGNKEENEPIFTDSSKKTIQFPAIDIDTVLITLPKMIVHPLQNNHQVNPCRGTRKCLTREAGRGSYGGSPLTVASGAKNGG